MSRQICGQFHAERDADSGNLLGKFQPRWSIVSWAKMAITVTWRRGKEKEKKREKKFSGKFVILLESRELLDAEFVAVYRAENISRRGTFSAVSARTATLE